MAKYKEKWHMSTKTVLRINESTMDVNKNKETIE